MEPDHVIALEPRSKLRSRHRDLFPILLSELIVICSKQVWSECHIINYFYIHESYWGILAHGRFCAGLLCFVRAVMTSGFVVVPFCWFYYSIIWLQLNWAPISPITIGFPYLISWNMNGSTVCLEIMQWTWKTIGNLMF